jgi:hypothetical protein
MIAYEFANGSFTNKKTPDNSGVFKQADILFYLIGAFFIMYLASILPALAYDS